MDRRVALLAELFGALLVDDPPSPDDQDHWADVASIDQHYGDDGA